MRTIRCGLRKQYTVGTTATAGAIASSVIGVSPRHEDLWLVFMVAGGSGPSRVSEVAIAFSPRPTPDVPCAHSLMRVFSGTLGGGTTHYVQSCLRGQLGRRAGCDTQLGRVSPLAKEVGRAEPSVLTGATVTTVEPMSWSRLPTTEIRRRVK